MTTFIEVIEGPDKGSHFSFTQDTTIGRSKADILLKDSKVSSTHAQVQLDQNGHFILVDLNSANGITINGTRVKKVKLLQGVTFGIGRNLFRVNLLEKPDFFGFKIHETWRDALRNRITPRVFPKLEPNLKVSEFTPALKLSFLSGIQADLEIILGFGPRKAGSDSLDIELLDQEAPKEAFELHPGPGLAEMRTKLPGVILLNNNSISTSLVQEGDLLTFGTTKIKISYL